MEELEQELVNGMGESPNPKSRIPSLTTQYQLPRGRVRVGELGFSFGDCFQSCFFCILLLLLFYRVFIVWDYQAGLDLKQLEFC